MQGQKIVMMIDGTAIGTPRGTVWASKLGWDPASGLHQGQRSDPPRTQAGQMTATCFAPSRSRKPLQNRSRPQMTAPSTKLRCSGPSARSSAPIPCCRLIVLEGQGDILTLLRCDNSTFRLQDFSYNIYYVFFLVVGCQYVKSYLPVGGQDSFLKPSLILSHGIPVSASFDFC